MKIAVLYIATGKYIVFWKEFFTSCETYFIPAARKEYFVFTDAADFEFSDNERVHSIPHKKLGWPYDTLMRFHVFSTIKERLNGFDYIFFFNANMIFVKPVTAQEFLPDGKTDDELLVTLHPGYYNKAAAVYPYEKQQSGSKAFIPPDKGQHYFMGGLNGGTRKAYLELIESLKNNTQADLDNNIIAAWHDESHLNKYMLDKNPKILSPSYGFAEGWDLPFEPSIMIRDKNNYGGHSFLRDQKRSLLYKLKFQLKRLKRKL